MPKAKKSEPIAEFIEPSLAEPEKHQCFLLFLVGFGAAEIEQRTGVRADKVRQWSCRDGWVEQRKHYETLLREKNPVAEQPIVQSVIRSKKGERRKEFEEHAGVMAIEDVQHWKQLAPEERLVVASDIAALNNVHRKNLGMEDEAEAGEKSHISLTFLTRANEEGFVKLLPKDSVKEIKDAK